MYKYIVCSTPRNDWNVHVTNFLLVHVHVCRALLQTYCWKLFENGFILLGTLREPPLLFVEVSVKLLQHGCLLGHGDVHVILHSVQSSQHKVEYANSRSVTTSKGEGKLVYGECILQPQYHTMFVYSICDRIWDKDSFCAKWWNFYIKDYHHSESTCTRVVGYILSFQVLY